MYRGVEIFGAAICGHGGEGVMESADIEGKNKVVGLNQTKKQILSGNVKIVYIANDADPVFAAQIMKLCEENKVEYDRSYSMSELGKACEIDVSCAVCAITVNN